MNMAYNHTNIESTDMNHTQPTPDNDQDELVVKITSPFILLTGIVSNILIIWILLRTRSCYQSFANYFTALAVTDLLHLLLTLLPKYVETYVHARFDVGNHLMCRLYSFMYYFLLTSSSLLLAAMTAQRTVGVVWPHKAKAALSNRFSYIAICIVLVVAALLKCQVLIIGRLRYINCYFGSIRFVRVKRDREGYGMAWGHFLTVFMLPFFIILVSNYLLISGVKASRKVTRKRNRLNPASQSDAMSSSGHYSQLRKYHRGLACCKGSVNSLTAVVVATSLFFCICLMPAFLIKVLEVGKVISPHSVPQLTMAVLNQMVYVNSSCKFFLYCITGKGFRQELRRICRLLLCRRLAVLYNNQRINLALPSSEARSRPTSFTSGAKPSPTVTPRTSTINSRSESSPTASQRQISPKAIRFENQTVSPHGQAEPRRHPESDTTLPHPCKTSCEPLPSTRSLNTATDTPIQAGETVPSEQHQESLLESGITPPHLCKTSSEPTPSTRSPNMGAASPTQAGETAPSEQHLESLPLSEMDMEADGNVTEPGKIMTLISVLKTNSGDLSHGQHRNSQSSEESSLAASVQGEFNWS